MPEAPQFKRPPRPAPQAPAAPPASACEYAELHVASNFSFLRGASHPDELVSRAAELGMKAIAITDDASVAGVVRAHAAAKAVGLPLIIGATVQPRDLGDARLVLHARDRAGYGRLTRLLSLGRMRVDRAREPARACDLSLDDVLRAGPGLLCTVVPGEDDPAPVAPALGRVRDAFGEDASLALALHLGPDDRARARAVAAVATAAAVPLVATNDVVMHDRARRRLRAVLIAVREGLPVQECGHVMPANAEQHLRPPAVTARLFREHPAALARTLELAARCSFSLDELRYEYPEEVVPPGETPASHLRAETLAGAALRYPGGVPEHVRALLEHELALVAELGYEPYFLTVHDLVRFARGRGILCQGRGSAANSAVCFCLGITSVDPARTAVLFERFISRARKEPPDIDVDFEHARREEVIQYVYRKYGRERAAIAGEVITYRGRSAVRDVGKALGLALDQVERLSGSLDWGGELPDIERVREAGIDPRAPVARQLLELAHEVQGFPRHLSQHVGGFVISRGPLIELVPVLNAAMPDRTFIEWDKDDLDELGLLKVDVLALGMLTCLKRTLDLLHETGGIEGSHRGLTDRAGIDLAEIPAEDPAVYEMLCHADTVGVFQIESRAQMSMLPRLRPRCFYDLVVEVSIVRPGPIQGGIVHPYLRRRRGEEPVTPIAPAVDRVLEKTLGVPVFQEQAMRLAIEGAGFTPDEADALRKAMGAWRKTGSIEPFRERFVRGVVAGGATQAAADELFERIRGFGEYGFPESHAASFAVLVYASAWLKRHHPAAFTAGLLDAQPMGFYAPAQLVADARAHGVTVRAPCVQESGWCSRLEPREGWTRGDADDDDRPARWGVHGPALRLGLRQVSGLGERHGRAIEAARSAGGSFRSIGDLARRSGLPRDALERLATADALGSFGVHRREALFDALGRRGEEPPLFVDLEPPPAKVPGLRAPSPLEEVLADYRATGLSLRSHPLALVRDALAAEGAAPCAALREARPGSRAAVAGLVICRQRPQTARGIYFFTLEDESGIANLILRPEVFERHRRAARGARVLLARGQVEREGEVVHLLVTSARDVSSIFRSALAAERVLGVDERREADEDAAVNARSRDFR